MKEERARSSRWETCSACGQQNGDWETRCQKCGRSLSETRKRAHTNAATEPPDSRSAQTSVPLTTGSSKKQEKAPPPPAFPEHLRRQLQNRVQHFRARKENKTPALPFAEQPEPTPKIISFPEPPAPTAPPRPQRMPRTLPRTSASAPQTKLNFHRGALPDPVWRSRPVAPLRLRAAAHFKDLQMIMGAVLLFLTALPLAPLLEVPLQLEPLLFGAIACAGCWIGLLYCVLFAWGSGITPGMHRNGLRLVTFDGVPASRRQRLWRIFGGIVSAGSFLIGFFWAVVDEESLYWHDHISKTYLTLADS